MKKQKSVIVATEKKQQRTASGKFAGVKITHVLHCSPAMTGKRLITWMEKRKSLTINPTP